MKLLDLLFPPRCLSCRAFLREGQEPLCADCQARWPALHPPFCSRCSLPFAAEASPSHLCADCLTTNFACSRVVAASTYEGVVHDLIVRMKYRGEERLAPFLGRKMAERVVREETGCDAILPIPLHKRRLRERGFNQALWLAHEVGKILGKRVEPFVLKRTKGGVPQVVLKGEERRRNLKGAFCVGSLEKILDKKILLVDDVYTTGTTIEEASRELLRSGAKEVEALVLARTL